MHAHLLPRLLLVAFTTAFIGSGLLRSSASADTSTWSDTLSGESAFVQACSGFDLTTSFTTNRTIKLISNSAGDQVVERAYVGFVGTLANDKTGQSLPYDGRFTRISDYQRNSVTVRDFELRIQLPTPEDLMITFQHRALDLTADPPAVLHAVAQSELESAICMVLGSAGVPQRPEPIKVHTENSALPQPEPVNVHTENSALPQADDEADSMTPWAELDPCDTSPPGQSC
jgi:hypothetical protein